MPVELFASRAGHPFISAHRGFSAKAPENTLAALDAAWRAGATVAEIDVQLTRDGHVILMHDRSIDRTTNGSGLVKDLSLAEIKALDAGGWFHARFSGERVPSLEEVLQWSRGRLGLLVELKNFPYRDLPLVDKTIEVVEAHDAEDFVVLGGFDHPVLADLHRRHPEWPLEMMYQARLADPVGAARAAGATLISLEPEFCLEADVRKMHAAGLSVLTTLLGPEHAPELVRWGVDFLESDNVSMVAASLGLAPRA